MKKIEESGKVSFLQAVKDFWQGYFNFGGRSTRAGYWWSQLCLFIVYIVLFIIFGVDASKRSYYDTPFSPFILFVIVIFSLAIIVPSLALEVRRLRDIGLKSKAILALYVLFYGFYATYVSGMYSSIMSSVSSAMSQYSDAISTPVIQMNSSPFITLIFMLLSGIFFISSFLPTNLLATESKNPILTSIFVSK